MTSSIIRWLGDAVGRRPRAVLVGAVVVTIALMVGISGLAFETSQESFIGEDNPVAIDNTEFQDQFGGEAMLILFTAEAGSTIDDLFTPENFATLRAMDDQLRASGDFHAVLSPVGALRFAALQVPVSAQMFDAANQRYPDRTAEIGAAFQSNLVRLLPAGVAAGLGSGVEAGLRVNQVLVETQLQLRSGEITDPFDNEGFANLLATPEFRDFLLYEDAEKTTIRAALRDNFLDSTRALAIVRLDGNIEIEELGLGADAVQAVVDSTQLDGFTLLSTGSPEYLQLINDYLRGGLSTLGGLAIAVMLVVLYLVFRVRWRLLSLAIVVLGAVWGFGLMGYLGVPLTLITISGLPILIGIGVDFSIQAHSRFEEEVDQDGDADAAIHRVMRWLAPPLGVAMMAAVVGFLSLQVSQVPQIRDFGVMLALGIAALFVAGLLVPLSIIRLRESRRPTPEGGASIPAGLLERVVRAMTMAGQGRVVPIAAVGLAVVVLGLALEGQFTIQTDSEKWVPQDSEPIREIDQLRESTGFSSEIQLLISAPDVTSTEVATWADVYSEAMVARYPDELVRGTSLPRVAETVTGVPPGQEEMEVLLGQALADPPRYDVIPPDFAAQLISPDRTKLAILFPIAPISLSERETVLDGMLAALDPPDGVDAELVPPAGTTVRPAGLGVVGIELVNALEANRAVMTWLAVGAVALWLLLYYRRLVLMALPLVPVTIAVGLSSLVTFASGVELSPLTSVTGPLVIATCTEFSVLILARYMEERRRGNSIEGAIGDGAVRIGRAFVASGLTTVGGFGVLALSAFPLLRDFGILIALNVIVALVSALMVLPPLLAWADRNPRLTTFQPGRSPRQHDIDLREATDRVMDVPVGVDVTGAAPSAG